MVAYEGHKLNQENRERPSFILREKLKLSDFSRILIVSHDRGGSEVIAHFVSNLEAEIRFVSAGPALDLFDRVLPDRIEVDLKVGLAWADIVIVSTGWQTDWEISAQAAAQSIGLRTVSVLDNWVNFSKRFKHHGFDLDPSEVWVVDALAARKIEELFPKSIIRVLPWNHYESVVNDVKQARLLRNKKSTESVRVLFLGENVQDFGKEVGQEQDFGFNQFDALAFVDKVLWASHLMKPDIRLRPHPSESAEQYLETISELKNVISFSRADLIEDLAWCDIAVGLSSVALYYASQAGIPTCTCFPTVSSEYHSSPWSFPTLEALLDGYDFSPDS